MLLGHETEDPVLLWKKLIGHYNPEEAKVDLILKIEIKSRFFAG